MDIELYWASKNGYTALVQILLEQNPLLKKNDALFVAIENEYWEITKLLIEADADIQTYLPNALRVFSKNLEAIQYLVRFGPNKEDISEAIKETMKYGYTEIEEFLKTCEIRS